MKNVMKRLNLNRRNEMYRAEKFVEEICDYENVSNEHFGNIMLGVNEAAEVLFSIFDSIPEKKITIAYTRIPGGLKFQLRMKPRNEMDEIPVDPIEKEILQHRLGRELFILKSLPDELKINNRSTGISLTFFVSGINAEKSIERVQLLKNFWYSSKKAISN